MGNTGTELLNWFSTQLGDLMVWGGGIWIVISLGMMGFAFKEDNGHGVRNGLLNLLGAALVLGAGAYAKTLSVGG